MPFHHDLVIDAFRVRDFAADDDYAAAQAVASDTSGVQHEVEADSCAALEDTYDYFLLALALVQG